MSTHHITMTTEQAAAWDGADDRDSRELMERLRQQAEAMRSSEADTVEIYTCDGIVAEVVQ